MCPHLLLTKAWQLEKAKPPVKTAAIYVNTKNTKSCKIDHCSNTCMNMNHRGWLCKNKDKSTNLKKIQLSYFSTNKSPKYSVKPHQTYSQAVTVLMNRHNQCKLHGKSSKEEQIWCIISSNVWDLQTWKPQKHSYLNPKYKVLSMSTVIGHCFSALQLNELPCSPNRFFSWLYRGHFCNKELPLY